MASPAMSRENSRSQEVSDKMSEAFRTKDFPAFLEKFDDQHDIDPESPDYQHTVLQRFEAFRRLPEVTKAITDLAKEKNLQLLGKAFTPEELKAVATELENMIVKDQKFEVLGELSEMVLKYRELPQQITQQKLALAGLGNRDVLDRQTVGINHRIAKKEANIRQAEGSHEGMVLAKESVRTVQDLAKSLGSAERGFMSETEATVGNYRNALGQLENAWQKLVKADERSPKPAVGPIPELSVLSRDLRELEKNKTDPAGYLEALAGSRLGARLASLKEKIGGESSVRVGALRKILSKSREKDKYPNLEKSIAEFGQITLEVKSINIDESWDRHAQALESDFSQVLGIRQGLTYLEADPTNRRMRRTVEEAVGDFQSSTGRQLSTKLKFGLVELSQLQDKLEDSPAGFDEIKSSVDHSKKGFMRRLISRDPAKRLKARAERDARDVEDLEDYKDQIVSRINSIDQAELELQRTNAEFDMNKRALSETLRSFGQLFKKASSDFRDAITKQMESENPMEVIKAQAAIDRLIAAREAEPELYGSLDSQDDAYDTTYYGNNNLRGLKASYSEHLMVKVEDAVRKSLENLAADKINPDSVALKLKGFEDGLGSLANTSQYKQIRLQAFKNLTSRTSVLSAGKKAVLGQMLYEARQRGFMDRESFDLNGFVSSVKPKKRAAA